MELTSKRLPSGRYQVRFSIGEYYGYLLSDGHTPVSEVLAKIQRHLEQVVDMDHYFQQNLFQMEQRNPQFGRMLVFRKPTEQRAA